MSDPKRKTATKPGDFEDDVVATPEGDNEYPANIPVGPVEGLQVAGGNGPLAYDADKGKRSHLHENPPDADHPSGTDQVASDHPDHPKGEVEETVDKLSVGQILT